MKTIKLLLPLLFFSCLLHAQNKMEQDTIHEMGLNISFFVKQILNSDSNRPSERYAFTYKRIQNKNALRLGFGFDLEKEKEEGFNNSDVKDFALAFRIGYERQIEIHQKFRFHLGFDFPFFVDKVVDFDIDADFIEYHLGIAPLIGLEYRITPRLSLTTESNFLSYQYIYRQNKGVLNPPLHQHSLRFQAPTALIFAVKF